MTHTATIIIKHPHAGQIAASLEPDNTESMSTTICDDTITLNVESAKISTLLSTLDDYMMNLALIENLYDAESA